MSGAVPDVRRKLLAFAFCAGVATTLQTSPVPFCIEHIEDFRTILEAMQHVAVALAAGEVPS